jgi:hypothetical protein
MEALLTILMLSITASTFSKSKTCKGMAWTKSEEKRIDMLEKKVDYQEEQMDSVSDLMKKIKNILLGIAIGIGIVGLLMGVFSLKQIIELFK